MWSVGGRDCSAYKSHRSRKVTFGVVSNPGGNTTNTG